MIRPVVFKVIDRTAEAALKHTKNRYAREAAKDLVETAVNRPDVQDALLRMAMSPKGQAVTGQVTKLVDWGRRIPGLGPQINKAFPKAEPIDAASLEAALPDLRKLYQEGLANGTLPRVSIQTNETLS